MPGEGRRDFAGAGPRFGEEVCSQPSWDRTFKVLLSVRHAPRVSALSSASPPPRALQEHFYRLLHPCAAIAAGVFGREVSYHSVDVTMRS